MTSHIVRCSASSAVLFFYLESFGQYDETRTAMNNPFTPTTAPLRLRKKTAQHEDGRSRIQFHAALRLLAVLTHYA